MKTTLLFTIILATLGFSYAQETQDTSVILLETHPDVEAQFPGGSNAYRKYISKNMIYPDDYIEIDNAWKIFASFFINTDGTISEVKIERGIDDKLDEMVKSLIYGMPKWVPAEMEGKVIKSRVTVAITVN